MAQGNWKSFDPRKQFGSLLHQTGSQLQVERKIEIRDKIQACLKS